MSRRLSRRKVLKGLGFAGASLLPAKLLAARTLFEDSKLEVAGRTLKLTISAISPHTLRINLSPIDPEPDNFPASNDSLVRAEWPGPKKEFEETGPKSLQLSNFGIRLAAEPLSFEVFDHQRIVQ